MDPTEAIVKFLRDEFVGKSEIRAVYDSDPDLIPTFELPAMTVDKDSDSSANGSTGYRDVTERIVIKVILDKSSDWDEGVDHERHAKRRLRRLVEARSTSNPRQYAPNTIRYALENRLQIEGVAIDSNIGVQYGSVQRDSAGEVVTVEAHLTIEATYSMQTPTRLMWQ